MKYFEHRHIVSLEETNMTGNVYFANHLRWQGRCREMFLRDRAPSVIRELAEGLSLLTLRCSCEYLAELFALNEISVRLFLEDIRLNRVLFRFEYWRISPEAEQLVARGQQEVACMRRGAAGLESTRVPSDLLAALEPYRAEPTYQLR